MSKDSTNITQESAFPCKYKIFFKSQSCLFAMLGEQVDVGLFCQIFLTFSTKCSNLLFASFQSFHYLNLAGMLHMLRSHPRHVGWKISQQKCQFNCCTWKCSWSNLNKLKNIYIFGWLEQLTSCCILVTNLFWKRGLFSENLPDFAPTYPLKF